MKVISIILLTTALTACSTNNFLTIEEYGAYRCGGDDKLAKVETAPNDTISIGRFSSQNLTIYCKNNTKFTAKVGLQSGHVIHVDSSSGTLPAY